MGWKKVKICEFLFEREGKYRPDSEEIAGLKRLNKIDFSGNFHIAQKTSKTNMILIRPRDLVILRISNSVLWFVNGTSMHHYS